VPLNEFFTGVKRTQLAVNELVTGLIVDPPIQDGRGKYLKKSRVKGPDLSIVGVAGFFSKFFKIARLAYGAVAKMPISFDISKIIFGDGELEIKTKYVLKKTLGILCPITDIRSTSEYRLKIAELYTKKLIKLLLEEGDS